MSDIEDPEILSDLALRASSERERGRTRGLGVYNWQKPVDVDEWKCRNPKCRVMVGVTQDAVDALADANRILTRRGEEPLSTAEVVVCDSCRVLLAAQLLKRQATNRERVADVVSQLKAGEKSIRVRRDDGVEMVNREAALQQLHVWGHPDVQGLRQWLYEQDGKVSSRRERRGAM